MAQQARDYLRHYLLTKWLILRVEVKLSEILAANGCNINTPCCSTEHATQVDKSNIGNFGGVGDVQDGEALACVGDNMEHVVGSNVLKVQGVEATAL